MSGLRLAACGVGFLLVAAPAFAGQHEGHGTATPPPMGMPRQRTPEKVAPEPIPQKVLGWEPVRCWRQSSAGAISIGEPFTVTVTCAVFESDNAQVIPDESRLNVASIQMAPFEILGGSHPPDVHRGSRRFIQYDYQLRIISPDAIGQDVNIPPLTITYRIHSRVGAAATLEGRDLNYLLPMMPIKILSLVPTDAPDIRDASEASLGAVESMRSRSMLFRLLTFAFGALGAVMVVLALVPLARRSRSVTTTERDRVPDRAVLRAAAGGLDEVRRNMGGSWSEDAISYALPVIRVVAALAINARISEKPANIQDGVNGRLRVYHGPFRRHSVGAASSVTAADVARARSDAGVSATRSQQLEGLESALITLSSALYKRQPERDNAAIDAAVTYAANVARDLAAERSWLKTVWRR